MYTQEEYLYGWLLYLAGVLLMFGCGWYLTTGIGLRWAKILVRVAAAVFFLVPWYASPEQEYLAPAWLIAGFEGVVKGSGSFWRAGAPLLTAVGIAVLIATGIMLTLHLRNSRDADMRADE